MASAATFVERRVCTRVPTMSRFTLTTLVFLVAHCLHRRYANALLQPGSNANRPTSSPTLPLKRTRALFTLFGQPNVVDRPSETPPTSSLSDKKHSHTLAIMTVPRSASARIANEAILETAMSVTTEKLSVILRVDAAVEGKSRVSLTQLRRYAGEIYSMAWDAALGLEGRSGTVASGGNLLDLIVYPQNMPNTPPEGWIDLRPDLSCICSHDSITGWISSDAAGGSGAKFASQEGKGFGGLKEHVGAVNAERKLKGLQPLEPLHVDNWPDGAEVKGDSNIVFLEDEDAIDRQIREEGEARVKIDNEDPNTLGLIGPGGLPIPPSSLYQSVCVGGTFDGMHYGHRKLLTLAISSVQPINGRLLIGVTQDEMLTKKAFSESIPPLEKRIEGVLEFIGNLAPGMKNRIRCVPINDEYGPPGQLENNDFDALILSHETLPTGRKLNAFRQDVLGLQPLKLLCTQRTEPHGMSSTAMRRMRDTGKTS